MKFKVFVFCFHSISDFLFSIGRWNGLNRQQSNLLSGAHIHAFLKVNNESDTNDNCPKWPHPFIVNSNCIYMLELIA